MFELEKWSESNIEVYAPIILFVYNRLDKTKKVIEALKRNPESENSELIVFSDFPKKMEDYDSVEKVREYIHKITGFKAIEIIERDENYGLARSIIEGVTYVLSRYKRAIILEDDIIPSVVFLDYMNKALTKYRNNKDVMEISSYIEPIFSEDLPQCMFVKNSYCWGWATWEDRWKYFDKSPLKAWKNMTLWDRYRFDVEGANGKSWQLYDNVVGTLDTWAVYWDYSIYKNNGYVLVPSKSLVENAGLDGSGEHQADNRISGNDLMNQKITEFPDVVSENRVLRKRIHDWHKQNSVDIYRRIYHFCIRLVIGIRNIRKLVM